MRDFGRVFTALVVGLSGIATAASFEEPPPATCDVGTPLCAPVTCSAPEADGARTCTALAGALPPGGPYGVQLGGSLRDYVDTFVGVPLVGAPCTYDLTRQSPTLPETGDLCHGELHVDDGIACTRVTVEVHAAGIGSVTGAASCGLRLSATCSVALSASGGTCLASSSGFGNDAPKCAARYHGPVAGVVRCTFF